MIKIAGEKLEFKDVSSPYWIISTPETDYPALKEDISVDVAIVGGGIVGITSAYLRGIQEGPNKVEPNILQ